MADEADKTGRLPWDRQVGEPEKAYQFFAVYRDLGRTRIVATVATQVERSKAYLYQLQTKWKWGQRAEAWDREQDRAFTLRMAQQRQRGAEQTLALIRVARQKLADRIQQINATDLTPAEWIRWFETLTRLERETVGLPSQTIVHSGPDGGPIQTLIGQMTDDERRQYLLKLVAEAQQRGGLAGAGSADDDDDLEPEDGPDDREGGSGE